MSLLDGTIAKAVQSGVGSAFDYDMTLVRSIQSGKPDPTTGKAPPPTTVSFAVRGFIGEFSTGQRSGSLIQANSVAININASSLSGDPEPGDVVTVGSKGPFAGRSFSIYRASAGEFGIQIDPAGAYWVMQGT